MQRIRATLRQCMDEGYSTDRLNAIYIEYDSLIGAARAVNHECLEKVSRAAAALCLYLCNQLPSPPGREPESLLLRITGLRMKRGVDRQSCRSTNHKPLDTVIRQINDLVSTRKGRVRYI